MLNDMACRTFYPKGTFKRDKFGAWYTVEPLEKSANGESNHGCEESTVHSIIGRFVRHGGTEPFSQHPTTFGKGTLLVDESRDGLYVYDGKMWKLIEGSNLFRKMQSERNNFKNSSSFFVSVLDLDVPLEILPESYCAFDERKIVELFDSLIERLHRMSIYFNPYLCASTDAMSRSLFSMEAGKSKYLYVTVSDVILFMITGLLHVHKQPESLSVGDVLGDICGRFGLNSCDVNGTIFLEIPDRHPWSKSNFECPYIV